MMSKLGRSEKLVYRSTVARADFDFGGGVSANRSTIWDGESNV
jgi:hypothetical protein